MCHVFYSAWDRTARVRLCGYHGDRKGEYVLVPYEYTLGRCRHFPRNKRPCLAAMRRAERDAPKRWGDAVP